MQNSDDNSIDLPPFIDFKDLPMDGELYMTRPTKEGLALLAAAHTDVLDNELVQRCESQQEQMLQLQDEKQDLEDRLTKRQKREEIATCSQLIGATCEQIMQIELPRVFSEDWKFEADGSTGKMDIRLTNGGFRASIELKQYTHGSTVSAADGRNKFMKDHVCNKYDATALVSSARIAGIPRKDIDRTGRYTHGNQLYIEQDKGSYTLAIIAMFFEQRREIYVAAQSNSDEKLVAQIRSDNTFMTGVLGMLKDSGKSLMKQLLMYSEYHRETAEGPMVNAFKEVLYPVNLCEETAGVISNRYPGVAAIYNRYIQGKRASSGDVSYIDSDSIVTSGETRGFFHTTKAGEMRVALQFTGVIPTDTMMTLRAYKVQNRTIRSGVNAWQIPLPKLQDLYDTVNHPDVRRILGEFNERIKSQ